MNNAQLINQTSGAVEYYTPLEIIDAAVATMGWIDLDPASCPAANKRVNARYIYTKNDNGLAQRWFGRVWMNHPFGRGQNELWINKLIDEWQAGRVKQACCIMFASTSESWFQPLYAFPLCFLSPRTNYVTPDGKRARGVTKGSVVAGIGVDVDRFAFWFQKLGRIMVPHEYGKGD